MKFKPNLISGELVRRYKRFLTDVRLANGEIVTAHCPNTGSMKNCLVEGSPCWLSQSEDPKRKLKYTWEIATTPSGALAGINTHKANQLVNDALADNRIRELSEYSTVKREQKYGNENSRIDFLLSAPDTPNCFVEVKNVTLEEEPGVGYFPDAVSARGTKHLRELQSVVESGERAVLLYCVQHTGIERVKPADHIDEVYGQALRSAADAGVEVIAYKAALSANEIVLEQSIPVDLS